MQGSVTVKIMPSILYCGSLAIAVCGGAWLIRRVFDFSFNLDISLFGIAGGVLGILLVIRLNAGYDRWWEARTLWGGIVNQSRNLVVSALAYGPNDPEWRDNLVRWTAVFSHAAHHSLRSEPPSAELDNLIGIENAKQLTTADHMPSFVALRIGELLREATERFNMDRFFYQQIDRERSLLLSHIGACERILTTPLPRIYSITIRRFILLFLLMLPLALFDHVNEGWLVPVITMFVAYPLLTLDQIGVELENPFLSSNLSHLPLNDLSAKIERNLFAVLRIKQAEAPEREGIEQG